MVTRTIHGAIEADEDGSGTLDTGKRGNQTESVIELQEIVAD
jgi:hypothetical protein